MFSRLREHFGTAGLVVAIVALVAVLAGGAYAATGGLTGKQKKEVKSIAKSFQGTGPAGAAGPAGPAGANGKDGANGTNGKDGSNGAAGATGATGKNGATGATGTNGTNGATGTTGPTGAGVTGPTGPAGNIGSTLAPGVTETGAFAWASEASNTSYTPISFTIKLASALGAAHVHYSTEEGFGTTCTGSGPNPTAPSGELCVYQVQATFGLAQFQQIEKVGDTGELGASTAGAIVGFKSQEPGCIEEEPVEGKCTGESVAAYGTWAVTG